MAFPSGGAGAGAGCTWSRRPAPGSSAPLYRVQPAVELQCAPVSLAPTTPQSSSPALLAAIAKPRAGIHIQLNARWMQRDTTIPNNLMLQSLETFAVSFLVCPVSRWWVGCVGRLVGRAGVPLPQPCPTLAGGAHRLTSGHNSCVSCVICSTLKLFSVQDRARLRLIQNVHNDQF